LPLGRLRESSAAESENGNSGKVSAVARRLEDFKKARRGKGMQDYEGEMSDDAMTWFL
jgi:hypothetical protein